MALWNTRPVLEQLWESTCSVWTYIDVFDDVTKQTTQTLTSVPNMLDLPCRLSYQQVSDVTSKSEAPVVQVIIKLFLPKTYMKDGEESELVIPAGSIISVSQHGRIGWFDRSGEPAVFSSHQEIILNVREEYA